MTRFKIAVVLALAAVPLQAKPRVARPGADELLLKMLAGPATNYAGVERVQVFFEGKKPKAMKIMVFGSPTKIRREVIPPSKKAAPLIQVRMRENPGIELARLKNAYEISVTTAANTVAKRKTWKLELRLKSGLLRRSLWVDRDSGLLMKRETYRDDGSLARRERFTKLELPAVVDKEKFTWSIRREPWTPDGFVAAGEGRWTNGLESYEVRTVEGKTVVTGLLAEDDAARVREQAAK